jgi:DNA helicase II / ATP-dependent DNA helicase PcrA
MKYCRNQKRLDIEYMDKKYTLKRFSQNSEPVAKISPANLTIDYEHLLNPAQYEAVAVEEGSYLIIAGAGTGKTRTLVYRLARLIELGYDPKSILLLTFTRKSAKEMLDRAALLLDKRCEKINGGTFHSYAHLILRRYATVVGLAPNFTILDQGDSEDVISIVRNQSGLTDKTKRFPQKATLAKILSLSTNTGKAISTIVEDEYPHFIPEIQKIEKIRDSYRAYKTQNNMLDYDDLLIYLAKFFNELSAAASSVLRNLNFVMVDEYQDTNHLQAEVVKGLCRLKQNIMVVGDDAQSIYSFRGATFENIMNFPKIFPNTKIITLEENYRSTPEILNFTNKIYEAAINKYEKVLYTRKQSGELPVILAAINTNLQSKFIVDKVLDLREQGVPLSDIAVLFRSSFFSFDLEIELTKANIPFVKIGGIKFVETAHIKDVLAFLRISVNPKDTISWFRVLMLHEGIGPKTAQKILDAVESGELSILKDPNSISSKLLTEKLFPLFKLIYTIHTKSLSPTEKAELVTDYYYPIFKDKYDDFNKRKKDIEIFLNISANYRSVDALLADMAIEPPIDSMTEFGEESKDDECLTLSTIHSAKGLEWHSIFIIHAVDGFFPSVRSMQKIETLEEERRLMYVAATRAKQNLFVSYPMNIFDRESGTTFSKPSRFISEITPNLADGWLLEE